MQSLLLECAPKLAKGKRWRGGGGCLSQDRALRVCYYCTSIGIVCSVPLPTKPPPAPPAGRLCIAYAPMCTCTPCTYRDCTYLAVPYCSRPASQPARHATVFGVCARRRGKERRAVRTTVGLATRAGCDGGPEVRLWDWLVVLTVLAYYYCRACVLNCVEPMGRAGRVKGKFLYGKKSLTVD